LLLKLKQFCIQANLKHELSDPDGDVEFRPEPVEAVLHLVEVNGVGPHVGLATNPIHWGTIVKELTDLLDIAEWQQTFVANH
jgi:hypothetical protein